MKFKGIIPEIKLSANKKIYWKDLDSYLNLFYEVISVNTSSLFDGNLRMLQEIREHYPKKFLIRKDFIMIPRQIKESKEAGADAVLIIRDFLTNDQYNVLIQACAKEQIISITETQWINFCIEGTVLVNSRDLNTGKFDREQAERICMAYKKEGNNVIYGSGESSDRIIRQGKADAVLIGTKFMQGKLKVCK